MRVSRRRRGAYQRLTSWRNFHGNGANSLFQVFARPPLSNHLIEQVLHHQQEQVDLPLLPPGHAGKHLEKLWVYLLGERKVVFGEISHC